MMTSVFKYAYPNAKIRAMKGLLLSEETFQALLQTQTFEDMVHVLQTTSYAEAIRLANPAALTMPAFTTILYKQLFHDYEKTIAALHGVLQDFFILFYQKYQLINLKTILRGNFSHTPTHATAALLLPSSRHTLFDQAALLQIQNITQTIEKLQGSFFEYPLNRALHRFETEQEFFPLEMALDLHYHQTLWEKVEKLSGLEKKMAADILGRWTDILNICWIIRFKEQYHFAVEEILNYTIHHGYAFNLAKRRQLAEAANVEEILAALRNSPYGKELADDLPLNTLHIHLYRQLVKQLRKFFAGDPFQIGSILGYLLLKEIEVLDLITLAEAKRYGFSAEQSQLYTIHNSQNT